VIRRISLLLFFLAPAAFGAGPLSDRVDAIGREAIADYRAPGLAIGVMRDGKIVFAKGYGLADIENHVPVTVHSAFAIASVTKNMTAAAILQLASRGVLSLDDDIGRFLPDFPHRGEGVTIRRLLDNTAGIHSFTSVPAYWAQVGEPIEPAKLIGFFRDAPLDFPPGTSYSYSNSGYVLLGAVIEKVSGVSYAEYLRSHLFAGMNDSTYCGGNTIVPRRVRGYTNAKSGFVNARHVDMSQGYSAGGVCSSVYDLLHWQDALHHGKLLPDDAYTHMIAAAAGHSYALGIGVGTNHGHRVLYHAGGINGFDAMVTHYPDDDVSIVVLANADGELAGDVEYRVARIVLGIPTPRVVPVTATERERFVGRYQGRGGDVSLVARDGALFLEGVKLIPVGAGTFVEQGAAEVVTIHGRTLTITHYGATRFEGERAP
jgi:CubicO group peptidase (beta-lactamase class C family)